jgi:hypothetical protein
MEEIMRFLSITLALTISALLMSVDVMSGPLDKITGGKKPSLTDDKKSSKTDDKKTAKPEAVGANPKSAQVFNDNKDNLAESYEKLKLFVDTRDRTEQETMVEMASDYIKLAKATLDNLRNGITEGIEEFESKNSDAKSFRLKSKMGYVETYLEKSVDLFATIRKTTLKSIDSDVEWLGSSNASAEHASKVIAQIDTKYATLDKVWGTDSEIKAHKEKNLPLAKKNYDKIMKQIGNNRMPKSAYSGGDKAELEKNIAEAYKARYGSDEVIRVVITSGWQDKTEISDDNVKLSIKSYSYISAHIAVKKSTTANVFIMSFRKPKSGGKLEIGGVGSSYPVLLANINK